MTYATSTEPGRWVIAAIAAIAIVAIILLLAFALEIARSEDTKPAAHLSETESTQGIWNEEDEEEHRRAFIAERKAQALKKRERKPGKEDTAK